MGESGYRRDPHPQAVGFILTWVGRGPKTHVMIATRWLHVAEVEVSAPPPGTSLRGAHLPAQAPSLPPFFLSAHSPVPPTIEQGAEGAGTLVSRPGELVTMACPVRGSPRIHVSWLKDGLPLALSQRTHLHSSGRTLR